MHCAIEIHSVDMMKLLIEHNFDCTIFSKCSHPIFLWSCKYASVECMELLLSVCREMDCIDIFDNDKKGLNGLEIAIREKKEDIVEYLLHKVYYNDDMRRRIIDAMDPQYYYSTNVKIFKIMIQIGKVDEMNIHWNRPSLVDRAIKNRNISAIPVLCEDAGSITNVTQKNLLAVGRGMILTRSKIFDCHSITTTIYFFLCLI